MKTIPPPSIRQLVRHGVRAAAVHTRVCSPARAGGGATILEYHSVADGPLRRFIDPASHLTPSTLDRQCAWLVRHRQVVSLSALVEVLSRGGSPEPGSVVLTFDGGYLDNLQIAAPILRRYRLPATLFVATDYVDAARHQWVDRLYGAFRMRRKQEFSLRGQVFDLSKRREELAAYAALSDELMGARDLDTRAAMLDEIELLLGAAVRMPRLAMDWDDLRKLLATHPGWEVGSQGAASLDFSAHSEDLVRNDAWRSIETIEEQLGRAPRHFSFPYGRSSKLARQTVVAMGLASTVAYSSERLVKQGANVHALGRLDARTPLSQLAFFTAGGWSGVPRRRRAA